jgi:pimeloyl-ACP methyl ester carboxylesterase
MYENLMMIHGMFGGDWCWSNYRSYFEAKGYHCITPTLRFHDTDPKEPPDPRLGTTSVLDYVEDLEKEIKKTESLPILMGHSMGGLIAQILGSRGLAKALILLTPASPSGILALRPSVVRSFLSTLTKWEFWKKPVKLTFHEAVYSMLHLLPQEEQRRIYHKFVHESGRAVFEIGFWLFDSGKASRVEAAKVGCPILIVSGALDRVTPATVNQKIANKYRSANLKVFPQNAHWVVGEPGWEHITAYVSNWMDRVLDVPSPAPRVEARQSGYVAGRSSRVFHRPDCKQAQRIKAENLLGFDNRDQALESGRRPCGVCRP